jgi:hypothetical protein
MSVSKIKREKYGYRVVGMVPSEPGWLDLFGDRLASPSILRDFHLGLFG